MADKSSWIRARIDEAAPPAGDLKTTPGIGRSVAALAEAVRVLEAGSGSAFGLLSAPGDVPDAAALGAHGRAVLTRWQERLIETFGDEGKETFETIVARFGVRGFFPLAELPVPSPADVAIAERVIAALRDPERLVPIWREKNQFDMDESLGVELGAPRPDALATLADDYAREMESQLPGAYVALWSLTNGVAIYEHEENGVQTLDKIGSEPNLWPIATWGDHFELNDAGMGRYFVFGEIFDSGKLALHVTEDGTEVVWFGRREEPRTIAPDLGAFLEHYVAAGCSMPIVLKNAAVPGWTG